MESSDANKWENAMKEEIEALKKNNTWELTQLPAGRKVVDCKWVFKKKRQIDGNTLLYKARLVARGFSQESGIDYQETFSPVVRFDSIRSLLSVAANEGLQMAQFDVTTAFLNGTLAEEIYMTQPEGFHDGSTKVCKLIKSLYGLKQAPRCWNEKCTEFFKDNNFYQSDADPCLFIKKKDARIIIVALYVDDGIITATHREDIDELLNALSCQFDITVCMLECFLGMQIVVQSDGSIFIHQEEYVKKLLERFKLDQAKAVSTPIESDIVEDITELDVNIPYRAAVGSLLYLSNGTRPDITFAVNYVSKYIQSPKAKHWNMVKRIFRYLVGTINHGILFRAHSPRRLTIYSDADYAGDVETRRSTTGYASIYSEGAITWGSQRQQSVAISTTEAEFVAASQAAKEAVWLSRLFDDLCGLDDKPRLLVDNQSAIRLLHNQEFHKRSKHIEVRYFFVRDLVKKGDVIVEYVSSECQLICSLNLCTKTNCTIAVVDWACVK